MRDVWFIPRLGTNLLSLTKAVSNGMSLRNDRDTFVLGNKNFELRFEEKLKTKRGHVMGAYFKTQDDNVRDEQALATMDSYDVMDFHQRMGHANEQILRKFAKQHGINLTGKFGVCEPCALAKSKQKNVPKKPSDNKLDPGELLGMDISLIKTTSYGGSKFWLLIVDYSLDYCWSYFMKAKSETGQNLLLLLKHLIGKGVLKCPLVPFSHKSKLLVKSPILN